MTKQKLIVSIVSVLLIIGVAGAIFAFLGNDVFSSGSSGSSGNNSVHLHNFEIETNLPSCSEGGSTRKYCTLCKYEEITEIPPSEHILLEITGVQETCTEPGYSNYKVCTKCNYTVGRTDYAALGHDITRIGEVSATCLTGGHSAYTVCSRCDYKNGYVEYSALGHDFEEYDDPVPTCTSAGIHHKNCTRCDEFDEEIEISYSHSSTSKVRFLTTNCKAVEADLCDLCGERYNLILLGEGHKVDSTGCCTTCKARVYSSVTTIDVVNINYYYGEEKIYYYQFGWTFAQFLAEIYGNYGLSEHDGYVFYNNYQLYKDESCETPVMSTDIVCSVYYKGNQGDSIYISSVERTFKEVLNYRNDVIMDHVNFECPNYIGYFDCISATEEGIFYHSKGAKIKAYDYSTNLWYDQNLRTIIFTKLSEITSAHMEWFAENLES